jgi:hypothetical protein
MIRLADRCPIVRSFRFAVSFIVGPVRLFFINGMIKTRKYGLVHSTDGILFIVNGIS